VNKPFTPAECPLSMTCLYGRCWPIAELAAMSVRDPERSFRRLLAVAAAVRNFLAAKATTREAREDARCAALAPFG